MKKYLSVEEVALQQGKETAEVLQACEQGTLAGALQSPDGHWMVPRHSVYGFGRHPEQEQAPSAPITAPEEEEGDIVLACDELGRYGIYLTLEAYEEWYSAGEALIIREYLIQHADWLRTQTTPLASGHRLNRIPDEELAEPALLAFDASGRHIVLARNEQGLAGLAIEDIWYRPEEALLIAAYLHRHIDWLRTHDRLNIQEKLRNEPQLSAIPFAQRPGNDAWNCILVLISCEEAHLTYTPGEPYQRGVYAITLADGNSIALRDVAYTPRLGLHRRER